MDGARHTITTTDGVGIGLLTAGSGPALLLVHGGMGQIERWEPVWTALTSHRRVTAMDRRGRGASGDADAYALDRECADVAEVAAHLAAEQGAPVDVFAHSYGATCTLGAAASGAPFRRIALYEPPGPETVPRAWVDKVTAMVADGQPGPAMFSFLTEIVGLSVGQVEALRETPLAYDVLATVSATMPREARALTTADLVADARRVAVPALLLVGARSPGWAQDITRALVDALPTAELAILPDVGHEAIDLTPDVLVGELERFFGAADDQADRGDGTASGFGDQRG